MFWERQSDRIAKALDVKAMPDLTAYDRDAETAALVPVLRAVMQRLAEVGAWDVLSTWDPDGEGWSPEMIQAWIAKAAQTNAERWSIAVHEGLSKTVVNDPANAAESVREFLGSHALTAALAAAFVTEAVSFGRQDAAVKSGLGSKTWRVRSRNPRASHAAQNGQTVPIGDVFANGLRWPGDHFGNAADNAGCTCDLEYGP